MIVVVFENGDLLLHTPHTIDVAPYIPSGHDLLDGTYNASSLLLEDHIMTVTPELVMKAVRERGKSRNNSGLARTAALFLVEGLVPVFSSAQLFNGVKLIASCEEDFVLPRVLSAASGRAQTVRKSKDGKERMGIAPKRRPSKKNEVHERESELSKNKQLPLQRLRILTSAAAATRHCWAVAVDEGNVVSSYAVGLNDSDSIKRVQTQGKKLLPPPLESEGTQVIQVFSDNYLGAEQNLQMPESHLVSPMPPHHYYSQPLDQGNVTILPSPYSGTPFSSPPRGSEASRPSRKNGNRVISPAEYDSDDSCKAEKIQLLTPPSHIDVSEDAHEYRVMPKRHQDKKNGMLPPPPLEEELYTDAAMCRDQKVEKKIAIGLPPFMEYLSPVRQLEGLNEVLAGEGIAATNYDDIPTKWKAVPRVAATSPVRTTTNEVKQNKNHGHQTAEKPLKGVDSTCSLDVHQQGQSNSSPAELSLNKKAEESGSAQEMSAQQQGNDDNGNPARNHIGANTSSFLDQHADGLDTCHTQEDEMNPYGDGEGNGFQDPSVAVSSADVERIVTHLMCSVPHQYHRESLEKLFRKDSSRSSLSDDTLSADVFSRYAYLREVVSSSYLAKLCRNEVDRHLHVSDRSRNSGSRSRNDPNDDGVGDGIHILPLFLPEWLRAFVVAVISSSSFSIGLWKTKACYHCDDDHSRGSSLNTLRTIMGSELLDFLSQFAASVGCINECLPLRMFITGPPGSGRSTGLDVFSLYLLQPFLSGSWWRVDDAEDTPEREEHSLNSSRMFDEQEWPPSPSEHSSRQNTRSSSDTRAKPRDGYKVKRVFRNFHPPKYDHRGENLRKGILRTGPQQQPEKPLAICFGQAQHTDSSIDKKFQQHRRKCSQGYRQHSASSLVWIIPLQMRALMPSESTDVAVLWCRLAQALVDSLVTSAKRILSNADSDDDDDEVASDPHRMRRVWLKKITLPSVASSLTTYLKSAVTHSGSSSYQHQNYCDNIVLLPPALAQVMPPDSQLWPLLLGQVRVEYRASGAESSSSPLHRCVEAMLRVPLAMRDAFGFRSILYMADDLDAIDRRCRYLYDSRHARCSYTDHISAVLLDEADGAEQVRTAKDWKKKMSSRGSNRGILFMPILLHHFEQRFVGFVATIMHAPRMQCPGVVVEVSTENLVPVVTAVEDYQLPLHLDILLEQPPSRVANRVSSRENYDVSASIPLAVFSGCPAYLVSYRRFIHSLHKVRPPLQGECNDASHQCDKERLTVVVRNSAFAGMAAVFIRNIEAALLRWNSPRL